MKLLNLFTIVAITALLCVASTVRAADPLPRPNILWIVCEDMSPNLACYGDRYSISPNIDKLASQGIRYTKAFATSPVCSASRTSLIFGRYGTSIGGNNHRSSPNVDPALRGYAAFLRDAGYYTTNHTKTDYNSSNAKATIKDCWDGDGTWRDRKDPKQPFMSVININTTHQSVTSVIPYDEFVKDVQSKLKPDEIHDPAKVSLEPFLPDTPGIRQSVARYYDCITMMDRETGQILADLEKDGLADNTIVFFYSDHGAGQPRHKTTAMDSGLMTPLIIRVPPAYQNVAKFAPGSVDDELVSFIDFGPTVLSLAGIKTPPSMSGRPLMGEFAAPQPQFIFGSRDRLDETVDAQRTVTDGHYRYVHQFMPHLPVFQNHGYFHKGPIYAELYQLRDSDKLTGLAQATFGGGPRPVEALYDSQNDPLELHNLIGDPGQKSRVEAMRAALRDWMIKTPDLNIIPEQELARRAGNKPLTTLIPTLPIDKIVDTAWMVGTAPVADLAKNSADTDAAVRFWAVIGLRQCANDPVAQAALIARFEDSSPMVQAQAAAAVLSAGPSPEATALLAKLAKSDDEMVKKYASRLIHGPL